MNRDFDGEKPDCRGTYVSWQLMGECRTGPHREIRASLFNEQLTDLHCRPVGGVDTASCVRRTVTFWGSSVIRCRGNSSRRAGANIWPGRGLFGLSMSRAHGESARAGLPQRNVP